MIFAKRLFAKQIDYICNVYIGYDFVAKKTKHFLQDDRRTQFFFILLYFTNKKMSGFEVALILVAPISGLIVSLCTALFNRDGVTKRDVRDKIIEVSMAVQHHIDEAAKISPAMKNDIRTQFAKLCRSFRFDEDEISLLLKLKTDLHNKLKIEIPPAVKIHRRRLFQSRIL